MNNLLFLSVAQDYGLDWIDVEHIKQIFMNNLLFTLSSSYQLYLVKLIVKVN